jgi:hypothetical protein
MTLELLTDYVAPCQMIVRQVYLLRVTERGVRVRVRERRGMDRVGIAERLPL